MPIVSACFTSLSSHKRLPLQSHLSPPAVAFKIKCVFYKSKANMSSLALLTALSSLHAPVELSDLCTGFKKEESEPGDLLGSSAKTRHASHAERWEDACPVSKTMGKNEECSRSFACFEMTCCNSCALPPRFFEKLYGFTSTSSPRWSPLIKNRTCCCFAYVIHTSIRPHQDLLDLCAVHLCGGKVFVETAYTLIVYGKQRSIVQLL